ncbi:MAG TPA: recombinase family protein [Gemmataceae bacterium]|nr:recombinase family protein [Gemmataceae bacterium]
MAAYCGMKELRLAEVFADPGISGGKPLASRTAGSQLLAAVRKRKAVVIVAKLNRLFRSAADAPTVIADFDKKGIQPEATAEDFDTSSPYGRAMAQMASVLAELERAMIRERARSATNVKRSRGERISGHAPFGWDFGRGGRLVRNAREQKIIPRERRLRAEGLSYRGIAARLDADGVRPKRGRRRVHTTVENVLMRNADWLARWVPMCHTLDQPVCRAKPVGAVDGLGQQASWLQLLGYRSARQ